MSVDNLPPALEAWLSSLSKRTRSLARAQRLELLDGFRGHFAESLAKEVPPETVLREAGHPEVAAQNALREFAGPGIDDTPTPYLGVKRWIQVAASVLCLLAYVVILLIPGNTTVTLQPDGTYTHTVETIAQSGDLGVLIGFAIPFLSSLPPLFLRRRGFTISSIVTAALLAGVASLGWFSNPGFFIFAPAAATAIAAAIVPLSTRLGTRTSQRKR